MECYCLLYRLQPRLQSYRNDLIVYHRHYFMNISDFDTILFKVWLRLRVCCVIFPIINQAAQHVLYTDPVKLSLIQVVVMS